MSSTTKLVNIRVTEDVKDKIKVFAESKGMTIKGLVTILADKIEKGELDGII